jgi:hypothetical protein
VGGQVRGDGQEVQRRAEGAGGLPERDQHHLSLASFGRVAGFAVSSYVFQTSSLHIGCRVDRRGLEMEWPLVLPGTYFVLRHIKHI